MTTKTVFYSVMGHSRMVAEGIAAALDAPLFGLTDRFTALPARWKRSARRAVRGFDLGYWAPPVCCSAEGTGLFSFSPTGVEPLCLPYRDLSARSSSQASPYSW